MKATTILFDLDETLLVERTSAEAAITVACHQAGKCYSLDENLLSTSMRRRAKDLWRTCPLKAYCGAIGISPWEAFWAHFDSDPMLKEMSNWVANFRHQVWSLALFDQGIHDLSNVSHLVTVIEAERRSRNVVFPEVYDVLTDLSQRHRLGVVTNGVSEFQWEKLRRTGLSSYFLDIVISSELRIGKPDSRIFSIALTRLSTCPEDAVMVGDSLARDITGAQQSGVRAVWLNRIGTRLGVRGASPDAVISELSQLRDLLSDGAC